MSEVRRRYICAVRNKFFDYNKKGLLNHHTLGKLLYIMNFIEE